MTSEEIPEMLTPTSEQIASGTSSNQERTMKRPIALRLNHGASNESMTSLTGDEETFRKNDSQSNLVTTKDW